MHHNRMIKPEDPPLITRESSEAASKIAESLISTYAKTLEGKKLSAFELMQSLAEFLVTAVKAIEAMNSVPPNFRDFLMRNIELNFDFKDGTDKGIDLSNLLIMGIQEEMEGDLGDI